MCMHRSSLSRYIFIFLCGKLVFSQPTWLLGCRLVGWSVGTLLAHTSELPFLIAERQYKWIGQLQGGLTSCGISESERGLVIRSTTYVHQKVICQ